MMHSVGCRTTVHRPGDPAASANAEDDEDVFNSPRKNKRVIQKNYWKAPDTTYQQTRRRLKFRVAGTYFETYQHTLEQFPDTMLGSPLLREEYYDPSVNMYVLPSNKFAFDAILFYYQSNGILSRPETVAGDVFRDELRFFRIKDHRFPFLDEDENQDEIEATEHEMTLKNRVWVFLEDADSSWFAKLSSYITIFLIAFSVAVYVLETLPEFSNTADQSNSIEGSTQHDPTRWWYFEVVCIAWFTLEYVLRLAFAPNAFRFVRSPYGLLDLIAIMPFYAKLVIEDYGGIDSLVVIRLIRITKSLRLLKISRYYAGLRIFGHAVQECQGKLRALAMCIMITVILFSSFIFYVEQPGRGESPQFRSIPDTFWYTIITMVTVGYGDVTPQTILGKILGGFCALSGVILLYCFPTPIVILHFNKLYKEYVSSSHNISKEHRELVMARS